MNKKYDPYNIYNLPQHGKKDHLQSSTWKPGKIGLDGTGQEESFTCLHCKLLVTANSWISGVNNRNHCPVCLHSRHLDHFEAGDRLSSCMGTMAPVALTCMKKRKKYGEVLGELMLIHRCTCCGKISLNRIAADDDAETIWRVYKESLRISSTDRIALAREGIVILGSLQRHLVSTRLYGLRLRANG
jgi:hypothetical protein